MDYVLLFTLLGFVYYDAKKYKLAISMVSQAQKITAKLDQRVSRNLDHILSVNVLTAMVLLRVN